MGCFCLQIKVCVVAGGLYLCSSNFLDREELPQIAEGAPVDEMTRCLLVWARS